MSSAIPILRALRAGSLASRPELKDNGHKAFRPVQKMNKITQASKAIITRSKRKREEAGIGLLFATHFSFTKFTHLLSTN